MQLGLDARGRVCGELLISAESAIRHGQPPAIVSRAAT
jgi:hypothetical protein